MDGRENRFHRPFITHRTTVRRLVARAWDWIVRAVLSAAWRHHPGGEVVGGSDCCGSDFGLRDSFPQTANRSRDSTIPMELVSKDTHRSRAHSGRSSNAGPHAVLCRGAGHFIFETHNSG